MRKERIVTYDAVLTTRPLERDAVDVVLQGLEASPFAPKLVSSHEPIKLAYERERALGFLPGRSILLKGRGNAAAQIIGKHPKVAMHNGVTLEADGVASWMPQLTLNTMALLDGDFACVHVSGPSELQALSGSSFWRRLSRDSDHLALGLETRWLQLGLPDPMWLMVFGKPYIELIGREVLRRAPVARVIENASYVGWQLTDSLEDVVKNHEAVATARERVRNHIAPEFWERTAAGSPKVPRFPLEGRSYDTAADLVRLRQIRARDDERQR